MITNGMTSMVRHSLPERRRSADCASDSSFNRKALQEYVLIAGQHSAGGLVDKPPKYATPSFDS